MTYYTFEEHEVTQTKKPFNKSAEDSDGSDQPSAPVQETTALQPTSVAQWYAGRTYD